MIFFLNVAGCKVVDTCRMENFEFPLHAAFDCSVHLPLYFLLQLTFYVSFPVVCNGGLGNSDLYILFLGFLAYLGT